MGNRRRQVSDWNQKTKLIQDIYLCFTSSLFLRYAITYNLNFFKGV